MRYRLRWRVRTVEVVVPTALVAFSTILGGACRSRSSNVVLERHRVRVVLHRMVLVSLVYPEAA